jgi:hypothetical protein
MGHCRRCILQFHIANLFIQTNIMGFRLHEQSFYVILMVICRVFYTGIMYFSSVLNFKVFRRPLLWCYHRCTVSSGKIFIELS